MTVRDHPSRMVLITSIFPPDIGGPATHVRDLRDTLLERGLEVIVLTLGDCAQMQEVDGIVRVPRVWPWPRRLAAVAIWLVGCRDRFDVVYATGMQPGAVLGAKIARRPVVVKVVGDPAWERGRREGLIDSTFNGFLGRSDFPASVRAMQLLRNTWLRAADEIVAPSEFLASVVDRWLGGPAAVRVVPNGVRAEAPAKEVRVADASDLRCIWVGRLVAHKQVERLVEAVALTPRVTLHVVGDGPQRATLVKLIARLNVGERVTLLGGLAHAEVMRELAEADALLLASDYEGLPHVVIEALSVGTPIVGPPVGGTRELLRDGETGIQLTEPTIEEFAHALARLRDDAELRGRLAVGVAREGARWHFDATVDGVRAAADRAVNSRRRVVLLGKTRLDSPPSPALMTKLRSLQEVADPAVVNVGHAGIGWIGTIPFVRFPSLRPPPLAGAFFYGAAPLVGVALAVGRRRSAIVCQSPLEGAGAIAVTRVLPRSVRPSVVVEVHGDWRTATRLYGNRARIILSPVVDLVCGWTIRRADRVRVIGRYTEALVAETGYRGPIDRFEAFNDADSLSQTEPPPLPPSPDVLFVGSLHRTKGADVLLDAWTHVLREIPGAKLRIVGYGPMETELRRSTAGLPSPAAVRFDGRVTRAEVAQAMDEARLLVVPSRSEGLGLVILEAMARGRPVIASNVGGIPELVIDGETGVLVPPEREDLLADAIVALLKDSDRCERLGRQGRAQFAGRDAATSFTAGMARLTSWLDDR